LDDLGERELIQLLRDGDYLAFDRLYSLHAATVLVKLKKLVHIHEIAEELHQDVFMQIWSQRANLPIDVPLRAILFTKAKSMVYNFYRKATLDKKLHEQLIRTSTELYNQLEEQLDFREANETLLITIAKLPAQRQKVFYAIKIEGKSYEEAAAEFGVSLSTIKDHMTRALQFIRTELSGQYPAAFILILAATLLK
jgi:RNA polymerase sigma factor, sigma-70 family